MGGKTPGPGWTQQGQLWGSSQCPPGSHHPQLIRGWNLTPFLHPLMVMPWVPLCLRSLLWQEGGPSTWTLGPLVSLHVQPQTSDVCLSLGTKTVEPPHRRGAQQAGACAASGTHGRQPPEAARAAGGPGRPAPHTNPPQWATGSSLGPGCPSCLVVLIKTALPAALPG